MLLAAALGACGASPREAQESDRALQRAIEAPQQRAKAVEAEVLEQKRRMDEELEEQGG